jgi:hypothetical protein
MSSVHSHKGLFIIFFFLSFSTGCDNDAGKALGIGEATKDLTIGRMRVAIWPEYDDPSVLVIYDGKFEDISNYPIKTSFLVPKGAVISDACSLSHEGQHFCQLYKTTNRGVYDEVRLLLPYPNFYLSFHTPGFDVTTEKRELDYQIKANHPIRSMEIDIQQPLRSTAFNISPAKSTATPQKDGTISKVKGFNHFSYKYDDISEGEKSIFKISYIKSDPKPSVDIKYASMTEPQVWGSPYETQKNIKTFVYLLFGTSLIAAIIVVAWLMRLRKKKQREGLA